MKETVRTSGTNFFGSRLRIGFRGLAYDARWNLLCGERSGTQRASMEWGIRNDCLSGPKDIARRLANGIVARKSRSRLERAPARLRNRPRSSLPGDGFITSSRSGYLFDVRD